MAIALSLASSRLAIASSDAAATAVGQGLALTGLLLVPAAIFAGVIGAMFPNYWHATPQALIRFSPHAGLLRVLSVTIGYGVAAALSAAWTPITWVVAAPLVIAAGIGAVYVIRVTDYSLAIMDPLRLGRIVHDWGATSDHSTLAIHDLARLVRGMVERKRRYVATVMVEHIADLMSTRGDPAELDYGFIRRALAEASKEWPHDPGLRDAVARCQVVLTANEAPPA